jgi:hypothetical protein
MVMRYHWGLGVGHTYSHSVAVVVEPTSGHEQRDEDEEGETLPTHEASKAGAVDEAEDSRSNGSNSSGEVSDDGVNSDLDFEDGHGDVEGSGSDSQEEYLDEMYGSFSDEDATSFG